MNGLEAYDLVVNFVLVLTRVSATILTFPLFGQRYLPRLVKAGMCVSLAVAWFPDLHVSPLAKTIGHGSWPELALALASQIVIGGFIGFAFGLVLLPARLAGTYISQEMGFSLGQITDPGSSSALTELGAIFDAFGILILLALNIHHRVLETLHASFQLGSVTRHFRTHAWQQYAGALNQMHDEGLLFIAPLLICLFCSLFLVAVLMRTWPQLNLFSFGIPLRFVIGFISLFLLLPYMLSRLEWFLASSKDLRQLFGY